MKIENQIIGDFFSEYRNKHTNQVYKTYWQGKFSENSFSFYENTDCGYSKKDEAKLSQIAKLNKKDKIKYDASVISNVFDIDLSPTNVFSLDFYNLISGKGNEYLRIRTLHSSALCGFLHFWKINQGHKIKIPKYYFDKSSENDFIEFDQVKFEFEYPCLDDNSSFDILLINTKTHELMFVELKFSEYFKISPDFPSIKYINKTSIYNELFSDNNLLYDLLKIEYPEQHEDKECIKISNINGHKIYTGGIKQLISHSLAMKNYIEALDNAKKTKQDLFIPKNIYYLELAYNLEKSNLENDNCDTYLNEFNKAYKKITDKLKKMKIYEKIKYANRVYTYQELFSIECNKNLLNGKTKEFYKYK